MGQCSSEHIRAARNQKKESRVKVYVNGEKNGERKLVDVDVVKENQSTIIVRLPDGNIISRKKKRDLPMEKGQR